MSYDKEIMKAYLETKDWIPESEKKDEFFLDFVSKTYGYAVFALKFNIDRSEKEILNKLNLN